MLYDVGKIVFIGGGNAPTNAVEVLDLNAPLPQWKTTDSMHFARRQHNATLLPDGTVLVMGGTKGSGGESAGFNDLTPGQPIHSAELWDPKTGHWTLMAKADVDRCYHSTAVLLPDATVLSAGGGEYSPRNDGQPNDPKDSHKDAQIFKPPYLFRAGTRPNILSAPDDVTYGQTFTVGTSNPGQVGQVNWVRLSSVTHSFNTNQRINFLNVYCRCDHSFGDGARQRQPLPARPLHAFCPEQGQLSVGCQSDPNPLKSGRAPQSRCPDDPSRGRNTMRLFSGPIRLGMPSCVLLAVVLWPELAVAQVHEVVVGITSDLSLRNQGMLGWGVRGTWADRRRTVRLRGAGRLQLHGQRPAQGSSPARSREVGGIVQDDGRQGLRLPRCRTDGRGRRRAGGRSS